MAKLSKQNDRVFPKMASGNEATDQVSEPDKSWVWLAKPKKTVLFKGKISAYTRGKPVVAFLEPLDEGEY